MEVLIGKNDIVVIKTMKHFVTKKDVYLTYGLSKQIKSARDLNPDFEPLEKDIYPIEIENKNEALQLYKNGDLKVIGNTEAFESLMNEII